MMLKFGIRHVRTQLKMHELPSSHFLSRALQEHRGDKLFTINAQGSGWGGLKKLPEQMFIVDTGGGSTFSISVLHEPVCSTQSTNIQLSIPRVANTVP